MIRISGVVVPEYKHTFVALTSIYGIGQAAARRLCHIVGIEPSRKLGDLNDEEVEKLRQCITKERVEGDLRREVSMNIKRLVDLGSYRGQRHRSGLPVRGQRTRTNARTRKGPRKLRVKK